MFRKLIWPSAAKPNQGQSKQVALPIPEHATIVIMQQAADAMVASVSAEMSAGAAQSLCKALLESASQLTCAYQAQCICEDQGAVFTSALGRSFSAAEGIYFYGEDFLIDHYSAIGHWIESKLGELESVCLDFVQANVSRPFAVCVCH